MNKYILQTDSLLNEDINKEGCHFRCLQVIGEIESDIILTPSDILEEYIFMTTTNSKLRKGKKVLEKDCYVNDPDYIINSIIKKAGFKKKAMQIGIKNDAEPVYWGWVRDKTYQYSINVFKTKLNNYHYVLFDGNGKELYDPRPGIRTNLIVKSVYYKII